MLHRNTTATVGWLSAFAVAMSGCASRDTPADPVASGVGVIADGCGLTAQIGSGVALAEPGLVVTVAHTIKGTDDITVVDVDATEHAAEVVAFDKDADLAVLRVASLDATPLDLAPFSAGPGSMLSWNRDDGVTEVEVEVVKPLSITIEDIYVDEVVQRSGLEIVGPVENGDSGGPVLDADGDVIGIIYATARRRETVGFATDTSEIAAVLATANAAGDGSVDNGTCF